MKLRSQSFINLEDVEAMWKVIKKILGYITVSISLAIFYYVVFAYFVSTDTEKRLIAENRMYAEAYSRLLEEADLIEDAVEGLTLRDDRIYLDVFNANAPIPDPANPSEYVNVADSVAEHKIARYVEQKLDKIYENASDVESNFRKIMERLRDGADSLPPLCLPLDNISYAQVGASLGEKVNPFYKVEVQHDGLDLLAQQGASVYASADGVVTEVIRSGKGRGNQIEITHESGYVTRYAHLGNIKVSKGQKVSRGKEIATVGITGNSFAPHLHYEVHRNGVAIDPVNCLFASLDASEYANFMYMASMTGQSLD